MSKFSNDSVRLTISAIHGDLTFSKRNVFLWVKLGHKHYELRSDYDREVIAQDLSLALANILTSEDKELECHLYITSKVFDTEAWKEDQLSLPVTAGASQYFPTYSQDMANHMEQLEFREKSAYVGISLGLRQDFNPTKNTFNIPGLDKLNLLFTGEIDEYVSDEELKFWQRKASLIRQSLQESRMAAEPVFGAEIAYIIRKSMFPGMESPTLNDLSATNPEQWGVGELQTLADGEVDNKPLWLEITQQVNGEERKGYRATLSFSKFPAVMRYPQTEPWLHYASLLAFPIDIYSRFTIEPSRKVRKQITNKIKAIEDQAVNMTSAGGSLDLDIQEKHQLGQFLEHQLSQDDTPWLYARHRLVVEASSEEELQKRVRSVIDHYKSIGITVVWPRGDQLTLLLEGMPSDRVRLTSYYQRHELSVLGAGVPSGSGGTGDIVEYESDGTAKNWVGPYLGYTISRIIEPVFLSMHSAIARDASPGLVITGSSGSGKSFTAFSLTYNMVVSGTWCIYIDPKADALPLASLPGTEGSAVVDLNDGMDGLLDPFKMGNTVGERNELVIETITQFIGELNDAQLTAVAEVLRRMEVERTPSLTQLTAFLMARKTNPAAVALGERLNIIKDLPYARLCFAPNNGAYDEVLRPDRPLTVITLLGLDLPNSTTPRSEYTGPNRMAVAIMYLLTSFTRQLMRNTDKSHPKAIIIDEAWAITSTTQGAKLVSEVARMGRAMNTALVLVSQNAGDFLGDSAMNSVSIRLAFKAQVRDEVEAVLKFLELENTPNNQSLIRQLKPGTCLMSVTGNENNRTALVQIDGWHPQLRRAFETNPERLRRLAAETDSQ